jgi:1-acyl-sn-glycerol-3-phosphate acyltransferase
MLPLLLLVAIYPRQKRFKSRFIFGLLNLFYTLSLKCLLIPITYIKDAQLPTIPSIIIANHQSSLDIPLIGTVLQGYPHIWLARSELMDSFWFRWTLPLLAQVIDVHNPRKTATSLRNAMDLAQETGAHIILFPEGSRSTDGQLQHFFDGFLLLAKKLHRPIVPIYINNVGQVYPRNSFFIHYAQVTVSVGKAFHIDEYKGTQEAKETIVAYILNQLRLQ